MYEDARAEREFRQNPPSSAPGQSNNDDGWGDLVEGSSSVESVQPEYNSDINSVLNGSIPQTDGGLNQPNGMSNYSSKEDAVINATIVAGKGLFEYFKLVAKSLQNNNSGDWHDLGVRICKNSGVACVVGVFFIIKEVFSRTENDPYNLLIGGLMSMMVGITLCMFFDKGTSEEKKVDFEEYQEEPSIDIGESPIWNEEESIEEPYKEYYEGEEDDSVWDAILQNQEMDFDDSGSVTSVDSSDFNVEDVVAEMPEITRGTQTRQYLFETFMKVLPKMTPDYSQMKEISIDDNLFFEFEEYLRGAAFQVGTKEENIPELESLYENPFVYRLNCTRPVGLKEQAIADEIASTFSRDGNNRKVKSGVYATVETSVGKYTINVFKGFVEDHLGRQIGGVQISLGDIYKQVSDFICSPEIEIPFVWGVNEFGDTLYCDMKDNNSIIISGEPRGGKSWKGQSFVAQLAMFHSPKEIEFYIFDGKDNASDYKYLSTVLPHVRYFCGDMDKINDGIEKVIEKMVEERGRILAEAGCINIKDYNATHPDSKLPYAYVVIDELMSLMDHFKETDQKEEAARFKSFLSTMVSKLPYTGIKFVLFPHRIVNDVISKNTYSLVSCRAVVCQSNVDELKNAVQVTEKQFPYKLSQKGDMALKMKEIAGGEVVFCHAEMLSSSNQSNKRLFDYIGAIWRKLEPDCECIEMKGMIGGSIIIDKGKVSISKTGTVVDHTSGQSEYDYKGYSKGFSVEESFDDLEVGKEDDEESFWDEFGS